MTNEEKMRFVLNLAEDALNDNELPVAAAIFHKDKLIASSYASENGDGRFLVHAEIKALLEADKMKFSFKERREMQLFVNLEPCTMCLGASMSFFMGEVHYSLEAPIDGAVRGFNLKENRDLHIPKFESGLLRRESIDLFKRFSDSSKGKPMHSYVQSLINL